MFNPSTQASADAALNAVSTDTLHDDCATDLTLEPIFAQVWVEFQARFYQIEIRGHQWIVQGGTDQSPTALYPPPLITLLKFAVVEKLYLPPDLPWTDLKQWADLCEQCSISVFLSLPECAGLPGERSPFCWKIKRSLDLMVAVSLIVLSSPILLSLALLIRWDSPGTIFFKQWRVGERGKLFRIYKFRTMLLNAEQRHQQVMGAQSGLHKLPSDPRVTRSGRWLRKYSLDELPQLLNVVRGEMSLVSPRPWALYDATRISSAGQIRLHALPGITGAWQVEARSTLLDLEKVNDRDLQYLREWSLWQDLKILLLTIPKVLSGFGAF